MKRKLYAALIAGAVVVSMMGTTVMASEGTTNFKYSPGTSGPTDPITPGDEETDANNWMVSYPRTITLMDNNESDLANAQTKGQTLNFKVTQRQAGADGRDEVTAGNVGSGITVAAGGWTSGTDIAMAATTGSSTVNMNLTNAAANAFVQPAATVMTLTNTAPEDQSWAVIKQGDAAKAVEGETYTKAVTFTFTRGA